MIGATSSRGRLARVRRQPGSGYLFVQNGETVDFALVGWQRLCDILGERFAGLDFLDRAPGLFFGSKRRCAVSFQVPPRRVRPRFYIAEMG